MDCEPTRKLLSAFSRVMTSYHLLRGGTFNLTLNKNNISIPLTQSHAFDKPFVDYKFQIARLKNRGLSIPKSQIPDITSLIKQHGYYQIVNGYGDSFEQAGTAYKQYMPDTSFEDIYTQFFIDRQLGKIILAYLLDIEEHFANILSYVTAEHFDVNNFWKDDKHNPDPEVVSYLSYTHFPNQPTDILEQLHKLSLTCKDDPTRWYIKHKNHVPSWILFMNAELGTLNRYYKICSSSLKKEVTDELLPEKYSLNGFVNYEKRRYSSREVSNTTLLEAARSSRGVFMYKGLELMREFRNCIAHNSRLFVFSSNYSLPTTIRDVLRVHRNNLYTNFEYHKGTGKNDLFALFIWIIICQPSKEARLAFIETIRDFFFGVENDQSDTSSFLSASRLPTDFIRKLTVFANKI